MNLVMPTHAGRSRRFDRRLGYFVLGSLLLHLLLVGLWRGESPESGMGQSTFKVTLLARQGSAARDAVDSRPQPHQPAAPPQPVQETQASAQSSTAAQATRVSSTLAHTPVRFSPGRVGLAPGQSEDAAEVRTAPAGNSSMPRTLQREQVIASASRPVPAAPLSARSGSVTRGQQTLTSEARHSQVRAALLAALLPNFDYPSVARRRGWEGRVRVGLHVEADGDLTEIHLVESSGHDLLDDAALEDVVELSNVPEARQWLDSRGMDVVLPVSYRLRNRPVQEN